MAEDWNAIAADVAAEIADVGFEVVLEQPVLAGGTQADPVPGVPVEYPVQAIDRMIKKRDATGAVLTTVRGLMIGAVDVVPQKGWWAQVRGSRFRINEVQPLAPGGVDLIFVLELEA